MLFQKDTPEDTSRPLTFLEIIYGILFQPRETFRYLAGVRPLWQAAVFLAFAALFHGLIDLRGVRALEIKAGFPADTSVYLVPLLVLGLMGAFLTWFFGTSAIGLVSQLFGGAGNGPGLLCAFSFALLPGLITGIVEFGTGFLPLSQVFAGIVELVGVIWLISLQVIALAEIEGLSTGRAILVYFAVPLSIMVSVSVLVGAAFAVLAPYLSQLPLSIR